jgi:hypothetical protein
MVNSTEIPSSLTGLDGGGIAVALRLITPTTGMCGVAVMGRIFVAEMEIGTCKGPTVVVRWLIYQKNTHLEITRRVKPHTGYGDSLIPGTIIGAGDPNGHHELLTT